MAKQTIGRGTTANDGTGDDLRAAMGKVNENFTEVYDGDANPDRLLAGRLVLDNRVLNDQTGTTYTLVADDNGKVVTLNNASAVTVTLPAGLPIGFTVALLQKGAGQVTVTPSATTMRNRQTHTKTAAQWAVVSLFSHATDDFILTGDTAA